MKQNNKSEIIKKQTCMCGHPIDDHVEQVKGKARAGECSKCECHYFCQREEQNKSEIEK